MKQIDNVEQLGVLIRETRKRQGLTQEQLAAVCGVGLRFIRELEHGKKSCHISKAMLVVKMLGLHFTINGDESE